MCRLQPCVCLSVCQCFSLSVCLSVCLPLCLSVSPCVCLSVSVSMSVNMCVCVCVCVCQLVAYDRQLVSSLHEVLYEFAEAKIKTAQDIYTSLQQSLDYFKELHMQ